MGDETGWLYGAAADRASRFGEKGLRMLQEAWAIGGRGQTGTERLPESTDAASALPLLLSHSQKPLNFHLLLWAFNKAEGAEVASTVSGRGTAFSILCPNAASLGLGLHLCKMGLI